MGCKMLLVASFGLIGFEIVLDCMLVRFLH